MQEICDAYGEIDGQVDGVLPVAVRSSATAEDLPDASFVGQQETFLDVRGIEAVLESVRLEQETFLDVRGIEAVLESVRLVFASLYDDRAIAYRTHKGFVHSDVAISAGVQHMVRARSRC